MGQLFFACAYDIETKTCCAYDADKFHANCYAFSGAVLSMHYLLRQKAHRVMWGGRHVVLDDNLDTFQRREDLLGISTYCDYVFFKENIPDLEKKPYYDKIKFVGDNHTLWNRLDVWDEAKRFFDWDKTRSVKYSGFLVNHTQKMAIALDDYERLSKAMNRRGDVFAIDALPVLTETGGGTPHVFFDGIWDGTTEKLAGTWCGDLLQIVDECPADYQPVHCCFAENWCKARWFHRQFGVNGDGLVRCGENGGLYGGAFVDFHLNRMLAFHVKYAVNENGDGMFKGVKNKENNHDRHRTPNCRNEGTARSPWPC